MDNQIKNTTSKLNQIIRLIPLIIIIGSFIFAILLDNRLLAFLTLGLLSVELIIYTLKLSVKNLIGENYITKRPKGAKDCELFIDCNKENSLTIGLPSGHSMSMGFFAVFMILATNPTNALNYIALLLAIVVMTQRWWIGCHSLVQIVVGATIGGLLGWGFYELINKKKWLPEGKNTKLFK